jgi:hypothetical protein
VVAGVGVVLTLFVLIGSSPLRVTSSTHAVAGVLVILAGMSVGAGLVYLVTIPPARRKAEGGRLALSWVIGLISVLVLGLAISYYLLISGAKTIPGLAAMSLGNGMAIMASMRLAALKRGER